MGQLLVPSKKMSELVLLFCGLKGESDTNGTLDRLLAAAAENNLIVTLLLFKIDRFVEFQRGVRSKNSEPHRGGAGGDFDRTDTG